MLDRILSRDLNLGLAGGQLFLGLDLRALNLEQVVFVGEDAVLDIASQATGERAQLVEAAAGVGGNVGDAAKLRSRAAAQLGVIDGDIWADLLVQIGKFVGLPFLFSSGCTSVFVAGGSTGISIFLADATRSASALGDSSFVPSAAPLLAGALRLSAAAPLTGLVVAVCIRAAALSPRIPGPIEVRLVGNVWRDLVTTMPHTHDFVYLWEQMQDGIGIELRFAKLASARLGYFEDMTWERGGIVFERYGKEFRHNVSDLVTRKDLGKLKYGVSITDKCIDWATTERMLWEAHGRLKACGGRRTV